MGSFKCDQKNPAKRLWRNSPLQTDEQVDAALAQLNAYWDELLSRYHVESQTIPM